MENGGVNNNTHKPKNFTVMRFLIIFTSLMLAPLVLASPKSVDSWKEATKLAKKYDSDILLLVHGSDWNRLGEKFRHLIWEESKFQQQLGSNLITLRLDYLESPSEDQKKSFAAATKGLKVKFPSYPVLALYDSEGKVNTTWTGSNFPLMQSQAVALITHGVSQRKKRDAYLAEAQKLDGVKKAEALYLAAETQSGQRAEIIKQLKACDLSNQFGYISLLEFNGRKAMAHTNKLVKEKKFEEAIGWLDDQWAQPKLDIEQKQWILAAKGNVYRRWGAGHLRAMDDSFMAAYKLDAESVVGKACLRLAQKFYPERAAQK